MTNPRSPEDSPDVEGRRKRLVELCDSLPEVEVERAGALPLSMKVRKKIFAYYAYDHHGDGLIALLCKARPGEQGALADEHPDRYFVPPYVGAKGWIGLRIDGPRVNWREVKARLITAHATTAPVKALRPKARPSVARPNREEMFERLAALSSRKTKENAARIIRHGRPRR